MMKNITMNLKHLVLTFTLAIFAVAANAVNVTYSLTTHSFTIDGQVNESRTITGTANLNEGADLLDNMPQALWRAYCTYTFTNEEGQPITTAPANGGTVYVDYVFDPPFIMSVEGEEPTWNYLRSYNSGGSNNYYVYYNTAAENEGGHRIIKGVKNLPGISPSGNPSGTQVAKKGHREWSFYGDAYNFKIKINDANLAKQWLVWSQTSGTAPLTLGTEPSLGWQLYTNKAKNNKISKGTVAMGVPDTNKYLASLTNVSYYIGTETANNDYYFDKHNQLSNNYDERDLWWYAFFATPTTSTSNTTELWHVTFKIQKEDGTMYPDYFMQKHSLNPEALWPPTGFTPRDGYEYDRFYTDANFTQPFEGNMPAGENTVLYIQEKPIEPVEYVAEQWKTLVLPYTIENVDDYFGTNGVRVLKYESVQGQLNGDAFRCNLIFKPIEDKRIVAGMPYLFKADKVDKKVLENMRNTTEEGTPIPVTKYDTENEDVNVHEIGVSMVGVLDESGYDLPEDDLHFFFGSVPNGDVEDYEHYTYKFYRVGEKIKNINVPRFVCYFYVTPPAGSAPIRVSFDTESITGVSTIVADIKVQNSIYSLDGRKIDATSLDNLKRGIYIVNGRKVVK